MTVISVSTSVQSGAPQHAEPTLTQNFLDWTQRPGPLKKTISQAFNRLTHSFTSGWGLFNGGGAYPLCGVDEHALIKKIIQQAPADQKDFYVLDIGAGNFQWSKSIADFIDKQADLPKDIKFHIIGIRGEGFIGNRVVETNRCKIYNLGAFKVEELFEQFKAQGLDLENKVDLAVSQWCFRHLADPVGTAAQVYNLLRPKTGYFLVDGFFFLRNGETMGNIDGNIPMTQLFLDLKAPFLTRYHNDARSLNHFMLRKANDSPCRLPMSYLDAHDPGDGWQIGSECVTRFQREAQASDHEGFNLPSVACNMYGDKKMHDWLKENGLLECLGSVWSPLQEKDKQLAIPSLHQAIEQEARDTIQTCLDRGDDINESDSMGQTPLHISVQRRSFELFTLLLNRGAQIELFNGNGNTALHEAAISDTEGHILQALIDAGAAVNAKVYKTPLDRAIEAENLNAVEILIKAGAEISEENYNDLNHSAFTSLHEQKLIPKMQKKRNKGGFEDVHDWIKKGECVVLHYNGVNGMMYHYPTASNKNPKLRFVNINPQFNLLDDGEWPGFLRVAGYEHQPYHPKEISKVGFKGIKQYTFGYGL